MIARIMAALSLRNTASLMHYVIEHVVPLLGATDDDNMREGATEAVASILCLTDIYIDIYI